MSKKKQLRDAHEEMFSTKEFFIKYAKRYGIVLLITAPIILIVNYVLTQLIPGYLGTTSFFVSLALLLLGCFIGLVVFTKIDDKRKANATKESERDPFAD
ncbi:MAG: hypothetical protein IKI95_05255 [Clostridia bacterium]|nr:hypothetical protein [Clostridia bacterium]